MIKLWIVFATIVSLALFSFAPELVLGESDRVITYPEGFTDNCYPTIQPRSPLNPSNYTWFLGLECESYLDEKFLKSSYFSLDSYAFYEFGYGNESFVGKYENFAGHTTGAINFTIHIDEKIRSGFLEEIKISKAEFRLLAIPLSKSEGDWVEYSGKFLSSLYTCSEFGVHPELNIDICTEKEELDSILLDTKDLPKFLVFDITGIVDRSSNSEETQFTVMLESKPIENITGKNLQYFSDLLSEHEEELMESDFGSTNYTSFAGDPLIEFKRIEPENVPKLITNNFDQPINYFYHIKPVNSDLASGGGYAIFFGSADFFIIPSGDDTSVSRPSVIVDYEKLNSDFSKAFTYFLGLVLPALAIIISFILWILRKKDPQIFPRNLTSKILTLLKIRREQ